MKKNLILIALLYNFQNNFSHTTVVKKFTLPGGALFWAGGMHWWHRKDLRNFRNASKDFHSQKLHDSLQKLKEFIKKYNVLDKDMQDLKRLEIRINEITKPWESSFFIPSQNKHDAFIEAVKKIEYDMQSIRNDILQYREKK